MRCSNDSTDRRMLDFWARCKNIVYTGVRWSVGTWLDHGGKRASSTSGPTCAYLGGAFDTVEYSVAP